MNKSIYNLYLITSDRYSLDLLQEAVIDGVTMVQLREKNLSTQAFIDKAFKVKEMCDENDVPLIINDNIDVAIAVDSYGLHVGQSDLNIIECRKRFPNKIIGVSATNLNEAIAAEEQGADYIGVGAIFKSNTKKDAVIVSNEDLVEMFKRISIPIILIGGIDEENIRDIVDYDIDGIAISEALIKKETRSTIKNIIDKKNL